MVKKIIALFSVIGVISALSGCSSTDNSTGNEYECGDFKFTISGKYEEDYADEYKTTYKFFDGDEYDDPMIRIDSRTICFDDLKTYIDITAKNSSFYSIEEDDIEPTLTDVVTDLDCNYPAGAIHYEFDDGQCVSHYYIENETRALEITAKYLLPKKKSVCRDIEALVASAEYISDFKLPTEDTRIDNKYIYAVVPKEWSCDNGGEEGDIYLYSLFNKIQVNSVEELYTSIDLKVTEKSKSSPEENADDIAEIYVGSGNETSRFEYEMFGIETECAEVIFSDRTERICYFEHNGYSWYVTLIYANDSELADIEDMLSRIELKP